MYVLPLTYILYGLACQATSYFNIFLSMSLDSCLCDLYARRTADAGVESTGEYSIVQVNIYPTFLSVIQIVTVPLWYVPTSSSYLLYHSSPISFQLHPCIMPSRLRLSVLIESYVLT